MVIHAQESADEITTRIEMLLASVRASDSANVAMLSEMLGQELRRLVTLAGGGRNGNIRVYPANRMGFTTTEIRSVWKLVTAAARLFAAGDPQEASKALQSAIALTDRRTAAIPSENDAGCPPPERISCSTKNAPTPLIARKRERLQFI